MLKRAKELLSRPKPASTVVCAEDVPSILEALPEPSTSRQITDLLETSLVEPSPQLVSLDPFEGEEEPVIHPTSVGAATVISQTVHVESNITKPLKVTGGKGPKQPAGGKDRKSAGGKDPKSAGGKDPKQPTGGKPPKLLVGGKTPRRGSTLERKKDPQFRIHSIHPEEQRHLRS